MIVMIRKLRADQRARRMLRQILLCSRLIAGLLPGAALFSCDQKETPPNVIVMLADDMGYSDLSCFGGEVPTVNIDRLANEGARFTQFYNGARCCPTRASLLTGTYAQQAGVGYMTANWGEGAYQGYLSDDVLTMGEVMKANGYTTFQTGKWHVGNRKNEQTPSNRGFDRSWWRQGKVHYFDASPGMIYLDDSTWTTDDPGYYLTDYTGAYTIKFIEEAVTAGQPFFGYVGWDACHWPLHAKEEHISRYRERYSIGWDEVRQDRLRAQEKLGLLRPGWKLPGRDEAIPAWEDIPRTDRGRWIEKMAAYAAQLHSLDENIGEVIRKLEHLGIADNTVIFILFDNGACAEAIGWRDQGMPGTPGSYIAYNMPWANVSNTPFRSYKHFVYEGGISTPMIMWGGGVPFAKVDAMAHIIDILPTILELTGGSYPSADNLHALEGKSVWPLLSGESETIHEWLFWEHEGNRAVRYENWKLLSRFKHDTTYFKRWHFPKDPRDQEWELYNIENDRTEQVELSGQYPERVKIMESRWQEWANRVGVIQGLGSYDGKRLKASTD